MNEVRKLANFEEEFTKLCNKFRVKPQINERGDLWFVSDEKKEYKADMDICWEVMNIRPY